MNSNPNSANIDNFLAVFDEAVDATSEKWIYFNRKLTFKSDVPLVDIIAAFAIPGINGLKASFPTLIPAPDSAILIIIAMGIKLSGTHPTAEIEEALNLKLP